MAEPAIKRMTVDEFLDWDDGTDTRYELVGGFPLAMAPPSPGHGRLAARLGGLIDRALLQRLPCAVQSEAGITRPDRADVFYIADLAVTCELLGPEDRVIREPVLIVEILSCSTATFDRHTKVADYRRLPSVQEILLIDSESVFAEILRREAERWITEIIQGPAATLSLNSIPLSVTMSELYAGIPLPEPPRREAGAIR